MAPIAPTTRRSRRLVTQLALTLMACAALGCGDSHEEGKPTGTACPTTGTLTYANFGHAFMESYCVKCHSTSVAGSARNGAPSDHNFDEVAAVRVMSEHIDLYAGSGPDATNTIMPPESPRPTTEERRQLAEWLACGAP